ncbi:LamG-like jellyroll fold domain-containing protein [Brevundimonas sp. NPDC092305]|uniref:LamG-like jellyroll fold domain-containing protein n=1 Tax=Brevundimonas sp. NPDC092305 TaxID=3363957 RepID=UPI0037FBF3A5
MSIVQRAIAAVLIAGAAGAAHAQNGAPRTDGLLFHMTADSGLKADYAAGQAEPTFADKVSIRTTGGARGGYLEGTDDQQLAWRAPDNIYASRGAVAFDWRSRYPVGPTPFVLFRVGYANHSSWDMTFLRIDWNGRGFEAFVTDRNLGRIRVSYDLPEALSPEAWRHIAFSWDETEGVVLHIDGQRVSETRTPAVLDAALDQFGTAGRIVAPIQVHSRYSFTRGSDYDDLRIYDHALSDAEATAIASRDPGAPSPSVATSDSDGDWRAGWSHRYGFDQGSAPYLADPETRIRRVEFTEQRDVAQRMWKGNDGVRETTWPGLYNRSRLPGRDDYFTLPDWNVYSMGGRSATWFLPDEPWNQIEIQGAAYGRLSRVEAILESGRVVDTTPARLLASRPAGAERTTTRTPGGEGGALRFVNTSPETPIQEIGAYNVTAGSPPPGIGDYPYVVRAGVEPSYVAVDGLTAFINGRHPAEERDTLAAVPASAPTAPRRTALRGERPLAHIVVPIDFRRGRPGGPLIRNVPTLSFQEAGGLDGIVLDIPALDVRPGRDGLVSLNIRVKDPTWALRDLLDVNVSVRPGEARTVFLDTRDRILADDESLYLTIAASSFDFTASDLDGMGVRMVFKSRDEARREHVADREMQIRDSYGFLVEERQITRDLGLFDQFYRDLTDLLRVDPENTVGRSYWSEWNTSQPLPPFTQPEPPPGVPLWAFRQTEDLKLVRQFVNWWIDNRQVDGEFGGGISDDVDLTNQWVGPALMGVDPDKFTASVAGLVEASYRNGMWTNGLGTIQTDELHVYEEGVNAISQLALLRRGDPQSVERLMATARRYDDLTAINAAGHRHIVSNYFSGSVIARDTPWDWSKGQSHLILHPGMALVDYNGSPRLRRLLLELADGFVAHGKAGPEGAPVWPAEINWTTDAERGTGLGPTNMLLWSAWRWTGDARYLGPMGEPGSAGWSGITSDLGRDLGRLDWNERLVRAAALPGASSEALTVAAAETGDREPLERLYAADIHYASVRMAMQTDDHWWSDRVELPSDQLQRARLGGVALARNRIVPGHRISWRFQDPEDAVQVAVLVREPARDGFRVVVWNTASHPVAASIAGGEVTPGRWRLSQGGDADGDDRADVPQTGTIDFGPDDAVSVTLAPGASVLEFALEEAGTPMATRPDVGIGLADILRRGDAVSVTVHSLGGVATPSGRVRVEGPDGVVFAEGPFGPIAAPEDLTPKTTVVRLRLPRSIPADARVRLMLDGDPEEISRANNIVRLPIR